jgi:hypothetical protein
MNAPERGKAFRVGIGRGRRRASGLPNRARCPGRAHRKPAPAVPGTAGSAPFPSGQGSGLRQQPVRQQPARIGIAVRCAEGSRGACSALPRSGLEADQVGLAGPRGVAVLPHGALPCGPAMAHCPVAADVAGRPSPRPRILGCRRRELPGLTQASPDRARGAGRSHPGTGLRPLPCWKAVRKPRLRRREGNRLVSLAVMIAVACDAEGQRESAGLHMGPSGIFRLRRAASGCVGPPPCGAPRSAPRRCASAAPAARAAAAAAPWSCPWRRSIAWRCPPPAAPSRCRRP